MLNKQIIARVRLNQIAILYAAFDPMSGENRQLVTDEPVEFEKQPVKVEDCRKIADHLSGSCGIAPI